MFDGVHRGHQRVIAEVVESGLTPTVVTFDPHPRRVLGYGVELLCTLERRLELLAELGVEDTLVVEFTLETQRLEAEDFAAEYLEAIGARVVVAGEDFRFGHRRRGDIDLLRALGFDARTVPQVEGVSSSTIRHLLHEGRAGEAAALLGRPPEVEGLVVEGDARGGTLGFPTANVAADPGLLVPLHGIYAGAAAGHRAAISIGTNPHYGGDELRIEAFLLGFAGDLYGHAARGRAVGAPSRRAGLRQRAGPRRPDRARRRRDRARRPPGLESGGRAAATRVGGGAGGGNEAHASEVVMTGGPAADGEPAPLELAERILVDSRLGVDRVARAVTRGRSTAACGSRPSSRIDDATVTSAVRSRVPPAEPIARTGPSPSSATLGAIMLCIRSPGSGSPTSRSISPSMLFK